MTNRSAHILMAVVLTLFLPCCKRHSQGWETLLYAERIIEDNPDSALLALTDIDFAALRGEEEVALYGLLYTQALVKNNYTLTEDTLIETACRYYTPTKDAYRSMKAEFYRAEIAHNNFNLNKATHSLMKAYGLASDLNDDYWLAKSAELLGFVFASAYNIPEWKKYTEQAVKFYKSAGKELNHRYALCEVAIILDNVGQHEDAKNILDSISTIAISEGDDRLLAFAYEGLYPVLTHLESHDKADSCLNRIMGLEDTAEVTPTIFVFKALSCLDRGKPKEAEVYIALADSFSSSNSDRVSAFCAKREYYQEIGMLDKALSYSDSALITQNEGVRAALRETVTGAQRDYYEELSQKASSNMLHILLVSVSIFIMCILSYWITVKMHRRRVRSMRTEIDSRMRDLKALTLTSTRKDTEARIENKALQTRIESIFRDRWRLLNILCNEYFEKGSSESTRRSIINVIDNEIEKLRSRDSIQTILAAIDENMDGIVTRLEKECPFLSQDDVTFLSLIIAGFAPRTVCTFTQIKLKYYYVRRTRLIERIKKSEAKSRETILSKLNH